MVGAGFTKELVAGTLAAVAALLLPAVAAGAWVASSMAGMEAAIALSDQRNSSEFFNLSAAVANIEKRLEQNTSLSRSEFDVFLRLLAAKNPDITFPKPQW